MKYPPPDFSRFIASLLAEKIDNAEDWTKIVQQRLNEVTALTREGKARNHWHCTGVAKCRDCGGNGFVVIVAGDGEWKEDCGRCEATGYIPVSWEP